MTTETHDPQSSATVIKELAEKMADGVPAAEIRTGDGRIFLLHRNDFAVTEKTLLNAAEVLPPKIVTTNVAIDTAASLIDYVNRFKNDDSVLFADETTKKVVAVIDYHESADLNGKVVPRHASQIATLSLRYADQWKTWIGQDQRLVRHVDFATFLEENQFDVSKPAGADLLELCRDLQVKVGMDFSSSIRMGDQVSVTFQKEDDVSTKGSLQLPVSFETTIPVFFGESMVKVLNWTRRKVEGGALNLGYKMSQRDLIEAQEFARIVGVIQSGVGDLTTIYGKRQA